LFLFQFSQIFLFRKRFKRLELYVLGVDHHLCAINCQESKRTLRLKEIRNNEKGHVDLRGASVNALHRWASQSTLVTIDSGYSTHILFSSTAAIIGIMRFSGPVFEQEGGRGTGPVRYRSPFHILSDVFYSLPREVFGRGIFYS